MRSFVKSKLRRGLFIGRGFVGDAIEIVERCRMHEADRQTGRSRLRLENSR